MVFSFKWYQVVIMDGKTEVSYHLRLNHSLFKLMLAITGWCLIKHYCWILSANYTNPLTACLKPPARVSVHQIKACTQHLWASMRLWASKSLTQNWQAKRASTRAGYQGLWLLAPNRPCFLEGTTRYDPFGMVPVFWRVFLLGGMNGYWILTDDFSNDKW